ncbi:MAG: hydantoinase B/oxoprolinase family protein [bacterium]
MKKKFKIGVDVGGTFTDLVLMDNNSNLLCLRKSPTNIYNPELGIIACIEKAAEHLEVSKEYLLENCEKFVHGTTAATNALLTNKGAKIGLLTTKGFRDSLSFRRGFRENVWDHRAAYPTVLADRFLRFPIEERIDANGREETKLSENDISKAASFFKGEKIESIAICFINSYLNASHEKKARNLLEKKELEIPIFLSSEIAPIIGEYERSSTTCVNAYIYPVVTSYLKELEKQLRAIRYENPIHLVQSNGGMTDIKQAIRTPISLVLSGPAAGASTGCIYAKSFKKQNGIFFDMGGTSTDVTLIRDGSPGMIDQSTVGGYHVNLPSVEVQTIGTGGGTLIWVDAAKGIRVGPKSAGSEPGPACYSKGGVQPTITDANLLLGRINTKGLLDGEIPLSIKKSRTAFNDYVAKKLKMNTTQSAISAIRLANQFMASSILTICSRHGSDPRNLTLIAGGGAGGISVSSVARICGIKKILIPREASAACAVGMVCGPLRYDRKRSFMVRTSETSAKQLLEQFKNLKKETKVLVPETGNQELIFGIDMQYPGQAWELTINLDKISLKNLSPKKLEILFHEEHLNNYGHNRPTEPVQITGFRITLKEKQDSSLPIHPQVQNIEEVSLEERNVYFEKTDSWENSKVFNGEHITRKMKIKGPAIIEESSTTILVEPGDILSLNKNGAFQIELVTKKSPKRKIHKKEKIDPASLAIFQNQLDLISRQMGIIMQRTARSTIFSQAHDFSCFITDSLGQLVSQADGLPIHTGSGGFAVRGVLKKFDKKIYPGDLFLLNDPYIGGGNHLPDWTVIAPVFVQNTLCGFVSNRAHQVDVGGGVIGTYNSDATEIFHEGIRISPIKIKNKGNFEEDILKLILSNTRASEVIRHDFSAMVGSTQIGVSKLVEIIREKGKKFVLEGFSELLNYSESLMRSELRKIPDGIYKGIETMNTDCFEEKEIPIYLKLTKKGTSITADFSGSSPQIKGYKNSPISNTHSALYTGISSLVDPNIPHNEGSYRPIKIVAPEGSVVNASFPAPVTLCTVFPAHEIIHCVWKSIHKKLPDKVSAAWAKTAYPITAGYDEKNEFFVIYHWLGGPGTGAVMGRDGLDLIGNLPTLGALTIPNLEHYEQDYPVHFIRQEIRKDGGGPGKWRGGTSVNYEVKIKSPISCSTRGESCRTVTSFGLNKGKHGSIAKVLYKENGNSKWVTLPQYQNIELLPGTLKIEGAGGGGFGNPFQRPIKSVLQDVKNGVVSIKSALIDYGVCVSSKKFIVDESQTKKIRMKKIRA